MSIQEIEAKFPISIRGLAEFFNRYDSPRAVYNMLLDDPSESEALVLRLTKGYFWSVSADVLITSLKFSHVDGFGTPSAIVYFTAKLAGSEREITKAIGPEKLIGKHFQK